MKHLVRYSSFRGTELSRGGWNFRWKYIVGELDEKWKPNMRIKIFTLVKFISLQSHLTFCRVQSQKVHLYSFTSRLGESSPTHSLGKRRVWQVYELTRKNQMQIRSVRNIPFTYIILKFISIHIFLKVNFPFKLWRNKRNFGRCHTESHRMELIAVFKQYFILTTVT